MLYRKFEKRIEEFFRKEPNKILLVNGARQIGKSYLIRYVGKKMFKNYIEINLKEDKESRGIFATVRSTSDFYIQLGVIAGNRLGTKENTLVFLDEIQSYPHLMTMLKFLNQEGRYTYVASGSQLGVALMQTASVPIGSIAIEEMYPLDFEEFLLATGSGQEAIDGLREKFLAGEALNESLHNYMLQQFKLYLLVGGLPEAINKFLENRNIAQVRKVQREIHNLYRIDASQYDAEKKLLIRKIYDMIPSNMENKKKRIVVKRVEETGSHKQFSDYADEFEYLTNSGIALAVQAISNPRFPLLQSENKNLLKHGFALHYYDNKQKGEVDFLIDDYEHLTVLPIEVKSGKDYTVHSALNNFLNTPDYHIQKAVVLSNEREISVKNGITYLPVYYCMFYQRDFVRDEGALVIPEIIM